MAEADLYLALEAALTAAGIDLGGRPLAPATSLDGDIGIDSIQLMQVARHLEKRHGYVYSVADWVLAQDASEAPDWTCGALVAFIGRALESPA